MMGSVTFLRMRLLESVEELAAATRRRQGVTVVEISSPTERDVVVALGAGLLLVSEDSEAKAAAWIIKPEVAIRLADTGVPGWRLTLEYDGDSMATLDALARAQPAYIRVAPSQVSEVREMTQLPGINTRISVLVDTVDDARRAVDAGARDLVLGGWTSDSMSELREAIGGDQLLERTAFTPWLCLDDVRSELDKTTFAVYLNQTDACGTARPRYEWAPGKDMSPPVPRGRFSAQWPDSLWNAGKSSSAEGSIGEILERAIDSIPPSRDEIEILFKARGSAVDAIASTADHLRRMVKGDVVSFVVNRNINYTNQCYFKCGFCAFSKGPRSLNLRGDPYLMTISEIVARSVEAWSRGATEVCLQGGIHPQFTGDFYASVVASIKEELPNMHIHGFTPLEVWQGAETNGVSVEKFLTRLRDAGLGTLPGTAAEILDDRIRHHLCPDKIRTAQWAEVMLTAHRLGMRSTATIMFGHIDDPASWANHFEVIRQIQRRTGGFTEIVPLPFVHMAAPIYLRGRSRPGPTWDEVVLMHSVARIAFHGLIDNIQSSWVKLGLGAGIRLLDAGCNDMGGTLMDETISHAAGASHGRSLESEDMVNAISAKGRSAVRRNTVYGEVQPLLPTS